MKKMIRAGLFICICAASTPTFAQPHRLSPQNTYERILVVVPLTGKGTLSDPRRPMYAPVPSAVNPSSHTAIVGFTFVLSDDGQSALAQFIARDRSAFRDILADKNVRTFLKGRDKLADAVVEFKKHKKDFDFTKFGFVRMP